MQGKNIYMQERKYIYAREILLLLLSLSFNSVSLQKKEVATTLAGLFKPNI